MKYNTTIDRMTKDEAEALIKKLQDIALDLMATRDDIPDGHTMGAKDAFISNAKVDIHNAVWELTKALQHLQFVSDN